MLLCDCAGPPPSSQEGEARQPLPAAPLPLPGLHWDQLGSWAVTGGRAPREPGCLSGRKRQLLKLGAGRQEGQVVFWQCQGFPV